MTRFQKKDDLIAACEAEHHRLESNIADLSLDQLCQPGVVELWSVKDILAHLTEWEQMCLRWYQAGVRGEIPQTPAPGYTWKEMHLLNLHIFEKYQHTPWETVWDNFQASYQTYIQTVSAMSQEELFTLGCYIWLGKHPLAGVVTANGCNHYLWAKTAIRRWRSKRMTTQAQPAQKGKS